MKIKTPAQFSYGLDTLVDANGTTVLDLDSGSYPYEATKQAIVDAGNYAMMIFNRGGV